MSYEIKTVQLPEYSMNYFSFGTGKKTMVILPGLSVQSVMASADAIAQAYDIFASEYTVYVFDRRNELSEAYSIHQMADDTAEAMKVLGLEKIHLFGASQGGIMSLLIASRYPELVSKIVVGSAACRVNKFMKKTVGSWIKLAEKGDAVALYLDFGEKIYPKAAFDSFKDMMIQAGQSVTAEELARFVIMAKSMNGLDIREEIKNIACPILILGAGDDTVLGSEAYKELKECLLDAEMFVYNGYGHAAFDMAPDYKKRIYRFFEGEIG